MFRIQIIINGREIILNELYETFALADDIAQHWMTSTLPEMGGVMDWRVKIFELKDEGDGKANFLIEDWSMDDEQPYYEHRILIRDNVDAAHYKTHRFIVKD